MFSMLLPPVAIGADTPLLNVLQIHGHILNTACTVHEALAKLFASMNLPNSYNNFPSSDATLCAQEDETFVKNTQTVSGRQKTLT